VAGYTLLMLRAIWLYTLTAVTMQVAAAHPPSAVADRVTRLTRDTTWTRVSSVPIGFKTFHPQGLVKIGDTFFLSSVEVLDRDAGRGTGHLFKMDSAGRLLADLKLGEGAIYHPGGLDYDGTNIWVAVAEYRPDSRSIIYRVDPSTMAAVEVLRFADHIGALVHDTDDRALHGVSWGSRRFYRWSLGRDGRVTNAAASPAALHRLNPSHYVDYQDCKYAGNHRMLCSGVTAIRQSADAPPFRLGGLELIDLRDGRPLHQVPILLWTDSGLDMTHNPVWIAATAAGLRAYFIPEDDNSTLYIYEATTS
jgi:hypothetical protein